MLEILTWVGNNKYVLIRDAIRNLICLNSQAALICEDDRLGVNVMSSFYAQIFWISYRNIIKLGTLFTLTLLREMFHSSIYLHPQGRLAYRASQSDKNVEGSLHEDSALLSYDMMTRRSA